MKVAILGASAKADRYSYKALKSLQRHGHEVYLVHPAGGEIEGLPVYRSLGELPAGIDTLSVYVNSKAFAEVHGLALEYGFKRILFNPGTESPALYPVFENADCKCKEACTLVLLSIGSFE